MPRPGATDYDNIPWRSRRFDEEALTRAVATRVRAENALDQLETYGGGNPTGPDGAPTGPVPWRKYTRDEALDAVNVVAQGWDRQVGIIDRPDQVVLFVTLDKRGRPEAQRYEDRFLSPTEFQWQSQNRNTQQTELGQKIRRHQERGVPVHLFVRRQAKLGGTTQPFLYAGTLEFQRWEGERPITVWWRMEEPVPEGLRGELRVGG